MIHDFKESLDLSMQYTDAYWWIDIYREAFPNLQAAVSVKNDGWAQRGGIDRVLTLTSGRTITVDEKVRTKDWPDILLEYWSDEDHKVRGWVAKDLACDFIAYAFIPSQTCYLIPFQTLRRAWKIHGREWVGKYRRIEAKNIGYTTVSVPIPIPILMNALEDAIIIIWKNA